MSDRRAEECGRLRRSMCLAVDDEITEIEEARVRAHLADCASCRAFSTRVVHLTRTIRSAPSQAPERPVVVERLRRRRFAVTALAPAAVAALALLLVGVSLDPADRSSPAPTQGPAAWTSAPATVGEELAPASPEVIREMVTLSQTPTWSWTGGDSKPV